MKRLIYKQLDGVSISNPALAKDIFVMANLLDNNSFSVLNAETNEVLFEGTGKNRPDALKQIKLQMKRFGVLFEDEIRNKKVLLIEERN